MALAEVLEALVEADVPVMVLKGLHLAEQVYVETGLRPIIDLNLLVPTERLRAAKTILMEMGFGERVRPRRFSGVTGGCAPSFCLSGGETLRSPSCDR